MTKLSFIIALLVAAASLNSASAIAGTKQIYGTGNKNCAVTTP